MMIHICKSGSWEMDKFVLDTRLSISNKERSRGVVGFSQELP